MTDTKLQIKNNYWYYQLQVLQSYIKQCKENDEPLTILQRQDYSARIKYYHAKLSVTTC